MDGSLVIISIIDLSMSLLSSSSPRIFGILRVIILSLIIEQFLKVFGNSRLAQLMYIYA